MPGTQAGPPKRSRDPGGHGAGVPLPTLPRMNITLEEAKAQLEALIDRSAAGEEVFITRDGRPVAQVVPALPALRPPAPSQAQANGAASPQEPRRAGWGKGIVTYVAPDFDEPLDDFKEYMGCGCCGGRPARRARAMCSQRIDASTLAVGA